MAAFRYSEEKMSSIMVFIPAYRCEKQIGRVIAQFTPDIAARFTEIVVVENQSPDNTLSAARRALSSVRGVKVTLLQNTRNYSLGGSHKVAFNYCLEHGYEHMLVLHGDDQGNIEDILPLLDAGEHHVHDSLLGARFMPGARLKGYSAFRTWGNRIFNILISLATRRRIYDMGAGLNIYKASFLRNRFYLPFPDDLTFNVYMLYYSIWTQSVFRFFPLGWREDDQVSNARIFQQARHILQLTWKYLKDAEALFAPWQRSLPEYTSQPIPVRVEE